MTYSKTTAAAEIALAHIPNCTQCPRLRKHCEEIARIKRKAFIQETYWGKPVSGLGDLDARVVIVGLAPAAHGANRTGRIFTGDRSGDWLYRALHKYGFANQPHSLHKNDGLRLQDVYITCVVKCAPPDNKPSPQELRTCSSFLQTELKILDQATVYIALGQIAFQMLWPLLKKLEKKPAFKHGAQISLENGKHLILSYHPSQQNTFTGRLTQTAFDSVFQKARDAL